MSANTATVKRVTSLPFGTAVHLIEEGDAPTLAGLLESKHVSVNERDETGQTLLMIACQHGQFDIVRDILRRGADVNADDNDYWSPLMNAAKGGYDEIVSYLIASGAELEHRDMGGWTALMWACYKGHTEVAHVLLEEGACANIYDPYHIPCLIWASGRGHVEIVKELLTQGAKVSAGDKYGTTPLVWASRKGHIEIVRILLEAGANIDTAGMYSWTSLIVAAKGNHVEVVSYLLNYKPNVNAMDKDGCTALTIACKEGFTEVANELLAAGAYINVQDKNGDTHLILACRAGHYAIVDALLKKYADTDIQGTSGKTALYWAVEKNHADIVRLLLSANPNLEIPTNEGDTALIKATRNRNMEMVQLLVDKKAKVSAADKKGDTALHVAMRSSIKGIVEILLRNPKNSQLLYRPNRAGETPYNIDASHQKSILAQIFGARRLNTNEDSENMLGYDLYSSALADILSEPSLSMPISVGLYAKWGSGKSFLLNKLEEEMRSFAIQWLEATFEFSWLVILMLLLLGAVSGTAVMLLTRLWQAAIAGGAGVAVSGFLILGIIWYGTQHYDWLGAYKASIYLAKQFASFKVLLQIVFCSPPATRKNIDTLPVKFLFTGHTKVSSSGGDLSVTQIIISLCNTLEDEYGYFTTRLFRVFKPKQVSAPIWKWRRLCCIPNYLIAILIFLCVLSSLILLLLHQETPTTNVEHRLALRTALISLTCVVAVVFLSNLYTWVRMAGALCISHHQRIHHSMARLDDSEKSHLEAVKSEVEAITSMVRCLDSFVGQQTRLVVVVDGLDSCEQEKVLRVLDAVHLLFSHPNAPFITILAIDPHIIIKAIESNIHRVFHNSSISGYDYLRNIVHLPFFLQNSGLRRVKAAQQAASQSAKRQTSAYWNEERECDRAVNSVQPSIRKASISSLSIPDAFRKGRSKGNHKLKASESMASSISNLHRTVTGAHDLTKVLLTDDYFSDVNPRSMRRLMNIVYVTGRLLKAFNIDFNWYHLASWINITEQWPYRTSFMILYYETREAELEDSLPLRVIYEKVKPFIPACRETGPLNIVDHDHDERKFEVFLSFHSGSLLMSDLKVFLPFTINLDPFIRKSIQEDNQHTPDIFRPDLAPPSSHSLIHPTEAVGSEAASHSRWKLNQKKSYVMPHSLQSVKPENGFYHSDNSSGFELHVMDNCRQGYPPNPPYLGLLKSHRDAVPPGFDKLSSLSVDGIQLLVKALKSIDEEHLKEYCNSLAQHNINGRVLLTCNLEELKTILGMTFGDWELFRISVLTMREKEFTCTPLEEPVAQIRVPTTSAVSSSAQNAPSTGSLNVCGTGTTKSHRSDSISEERLPGTTSGESILVSSRGSIDERRTDVIRHRARSANTALEKQVTMEESLIVGALETLNEEAYEDASEERALESNDAPPVSHLQQHLQLNPLSPILSDPEELSSDISSAAHSPAAPEELDVMYLKGAKPSPIMHSRTATFDDGGWDYDPISPVPSSQMLASSCETSPVHQLPQHYISELSNANSQNCSLASSPTGKDTSGYKFLADSQSLLPFSDDRKTLYQSTEGTISGLMQPSNLLTFIASSLDSLPKLQSCISEVTFGGVHYSSDHALLPNTTAVNHEFTNDNFASESSDDLIEVKPRVLHKNKHRHSKDGNSWNQSSSKMNNNFSMNNNMESEDEETPLVSPVHSKSVSQKMVGSKPLAGSPPQSSIRKSKSEPSQRRPPLKRQVSIETVSTVVLEDGGSPALPRSATQPLKQFSKKESPLHPNSPVSQTSIESLENSNETVL